MIEFDFWSHCYFQEGEQGYLEGLASRYADLFRTHYSDVLEPLEELRRRETNASPRMPNTQLTTSHSQPIYVPGKYSVSHKYCEFDRWTIFFESFRLYRDPHPPPHPLESMRKDILSFTYLFAKVVTFLLWQGRCVWISLCVQEYFI